MKIAKVQFVLALAALAWGATCTAASVRQLLQTADYVGVDYAGAVHDGTVISPAEYAEMQEFVALLQDGAAQLPATGGRESLRTAIADLAEAVARKAPPGDVVKLTRQISADLNRWYPVLQVPEQAPSPALGKDLYASQCAGCHGAEGGGDGPAAAALDPPPTNFQDVARASRRSLFGLYNTVTLGVPGTAMAPFSGLDDHQRWSVSFYAASLQQQPQEPSQAAFARVAPKLGAKGLLTSSATALQSDYGADGPAALAWLRAHPRSLMAVAGPAADSGGIGIALSKLQASRDAWQAGDSDQARQLALSAYLDGFELVEAPLKNVDNALMRETEQAMAGWRAALKDGDAGRIEAAYARAADLLKRSEDALGGGALAGGVAFVSAYIILAREGLEAILVVAALLVVVRRADVSPAERRRALGALNLGWMLALGAGLATWMVSNWVLAISGALRELTEGVTALLAAAVLLWVGLWMHGQAAAREWGRFVGDTAGRAVVERSKWLLLGLSFLSVYREIFETVLFYQALWLQVDAPQQSLVLWGVGAAGLTLAGLTWLILRAGQRLPLKVFFTVCAYTVLVLAVIFTGKGIAALQEAGRLPISPIDLPTVELIGLYPSAQGLAMQLAVLVLALIWLIRQRRTATAAGTR